ncbi:MAG: molybdopterin molybdotransferase MoeA [Proteobacteria bacterium]|nr:molybdopterin molybdotransferase MoeA [Pseudomonadota bacterium]MDA1331926.1 molybdopterin molybdotransferase MoeA [Pseudomonadota bacterium]
MTKQNKLEIITQDNDYDPNSMPVDKARSYIGGFLDPVTSSERVFIRDALGRILSQDVISPVNVPQHDNSAMDGYAVRGVDLEEGKKIELTVVGTAFAGQPFEGAIKKGESIRIMTGAVIPDGADTVIMQERAERAASVVTVDFLPTGSNTRKTGEDLKLGSVALHKGHKVRPADLGLIASLGIPEISVYRKLRVAFFSTGDELVGIGNTLGEGEIYDSNRYTIFGMLTELGCELIDMGVIKDTPEAVEVAFRDATSIADVVITSGGVSVGEADFVKPILNLLGEVLFWKIAMKPGRPLAFGKVGRSHFFGLPGNPVAVMVTFYQFVQSALKTLQGQVMRTPSPTFKARCTEPLKKTPGRTEFQRGIFSQTLTGEWTVKPTGDQGSGILSSMSQAHCFIVLPTDMGKVDAGEIVDVQLIRGLIDS